MNKFFSLILSLFLTINSILIAMEKNQNDETKENYLVPSMQLKKHRAIVRLLKDCQKIKEANNISFPVCSESKEEKNNKKY